MSAAQLIAKRARLVASGVVAEVPSPCLSICRMEPGNQFCEGCFRTLSEIAAWGQLPDGEKRLVWEAIATRAAARVAQP